MNTFIRAHKDSFTKTGTWEEDFYRNSTHSPSLILLGTELWDLPNQTVKQVHSFNNHLNGDCTDVPGARGTKITKTARSLLVVKMSPPLKKMGKPGSSQLCNGQQEEFSRQSVRHAERGWRRARSVQGTANRPVQLPSGEQEVTNDEVEFAGD